MKDQGPLGKDEAVNDPQVEDKEGAYKRTSHIAIGTHQCHETGSPTHLI